MIEVREQVPLASYTTLGLGGAARYFIACRDDQELIEAITWTQERELPLLILGGGSNLIVGDAGFAGAVIHLCMASLEIHPDSGGATISAEAGVIWDELVRTAVQRNLAGIECLSGIPGSAGATPIQNVGAYGQEVSESIQAVEVLEIPTLRSHLIAARECGFTYRHSRFRAEPGRSIITRVIFRLEEREPVIRYGELTRHLERTAHGPDAAPTLQDVRSAVLALRRQKSMVVDPADPHSRSAGSFFLNPLLTQEEFDRLQERWLSRGSGDPVPSFGAGENRKIPAAWLVEHAGFARGYRLGGVGISSHHALALVNYGGTTTELMELAERIMHAVKETFGINLEREPVLVG